MFFCYIPERISIIFEYLIPSRDALPGATVMLSLKRWFSVSFSPPYNPSQPPDYSDFDPQCSGTGFART